MTDGAAEVARRARSGDPLASQVFIEAGAGVARAALMVAAIVDIGDVVVGGGLSGVSDLLGPAIEEVLAAQPSVSGRQVPVRFSSLGASAAAVGRPGSPEIW